MFPSAAGLVVAGQRYFVGPRLNLSPLLLMFLRVLQVSTMRALVEVTNAEKKYAAAAFAGAIAFRAASKSALVAGTLRAGAVAARAAAAAAEAKVFAVPAS